MLLDRKKEKLILKKKEFESELENYFKPNINSESLKIVIKIFFFFLNVSLYFFFMKENIKFY